jgi:ABC-2 type transport system ATP-binding protein
VEGLGSSTSLAHAGEPASYGESPSALEVNDLVVSYGDIRAVDGVSFHVTEGEIFGLLGPNGAGKTTTIRVLTTLLRAYSGTATVCGLDVSRNRMQVRQAIGYVPQQLSVDGGLTGWENVWLFARLFDVPRSARAGRIADALEVVGLTDVARRLTRTYSGGMIRRLELAQALVNRPRVLILDEPTLGLDPLARSGVWERVERLREELGMSVLLTTHYMDEADALCSRVAIMHKGRIRASGAPAALKAALGPEATLEDVFRHHAQDEAGLQPGSEGIRGVRGARRTGRRVG